VRTVKYSIQRVLNLVGLELRRQQLAKPQIDPPPPLYDDLLEAMHEVRAGNPAAFRCPIHKTVDLKGFGFSRAKWHPFVAALRGAAASPHVQVGLELASFYSRHQPRHAGEAIVGFEDYPTSFLELPPHLYHLTPWNGKSAEIVDATVRHWTWVDNAESGSAGLSLDHGFMLHGPVHKRKAEVQARRLVALAESIRSHGFDRSHGDPLFLVLKRSNEFAFVADGGGYHRTATMAALDHDWIPGQFYPGPIFIDIDEVEYWVQVRRGVWSRGQAVSYFHHLFDFDSRTWARDQGLADE
jgi:hypothetical protein